MMLFVLFGVLGEGKSLKANVLASGIEILSLDQTTPKKSMVSLRMLIFDGLIFKLACLSFSRITASFSRWSWIVPFVASFVQDLFPRS